VLQSFHSSVRKGSDAVWMGK